jgi:hypothetical protein
VLAARIPDDNSNCSLSGLLNEGSIDVDAYNYLTALKFFYSSIMVKSIRQTSILKSIRNWTQHQTLDKTANASGRQQTHILFELKIQHAQTCF